MVEQWNSTNGFILYSKGGEFATNQRGEQVLVMLSLHLLQVCLVYINTLMLQRVLEEPIWRQRLLEKDRRALTPLIYSHLTLASLKAWRFYPQRETLELVYTSSPMSLPSDSIFPDSRAVLKPLSLTTWAAAVSRSLW